MPTPEEELRAIAEELARLRYQQRELESRVQSLQSRITPVPQEAPVRHATPPPLPLPVPVQLPEQNREVQEAEQRREQVLETTVGLNWVNRVGVITLILGAAFFFKYAVDSGWIGPGLRVLLGLL